MKFGVREICDVTFKALQAGKLGKMDVVKGQPVLYIDSAKTSTIEGAATTVYAQGGKGNARLIAWEGEKTLTFTVEDALLSPIGFAMLSGAGLFTPEDKGVAYVHMTGIADIISGEQKKTATITLEGREELATNAPLFVMEYLDGSIGNVLQASAAAAYDSSSDETTVTITITGTPAERVNQIFADFYVKKTEQVTELQIDAENFAGYYYVEGSTLFRRESDGKDLPAEIVFPKVKIQSNFTFTMASSGDPSTFTFTMDALPAYTMFNKTKKALCAIQIIEDSVRGSAANSAVTIGSPSIEIDEAKDMTSTDKGDSGELTATTPAV